MQIHIKTAARAFKGWSVYKLAKELNLPQQTVYSWVNGRTQPSYENMDRLCDILGCAIEHLFTADSVALPNC
jgi:transcriptional regulator with XRE-family HTH domain